MASPDQGPADRGPGTWEPSRGVSLRRWVAIDGNRGVVTGVFLVGTSLLLVVVGLLSGPVRQEEASPLFYLYSVLVGGNFTLVTIVISVSQLVISRQLGTPGAISDDIESTTEFRRSIEEGTGVDVAPVTPTAFLQLLVRSAAERTVEVSRMAEGKEGAAWDDLRESVDRFADHLGRVEANLSRTEVSVVSTLGVTLDTNYSADVYDFRLLKRRYGDSYPEDVEDSLDALIDRLHHIDVGRQYLKTLYMQDELSKLSRTLLYVGIPAVLSSVAMLRLFAVGLANLSRELLFVVVPLTVAIALVPLLVLFAYVLRITTVSRRTIAITPFTMATNEREREPLHRE